MKKLSFLVFAFIIISFAGSINAQKFGRYQVAIIPDAFDRVYSGMTQKALGEDKRFLFISEKDLPSIVKEWERRQSGITEDDSITLLKNVNYFVEVTNVQNSGPIRVENKDKDGNVTVTYDTTITLDIKVTDVQAGGEVKTRTASGQGNDKDPAVSQKSALNGLQSSIKVGVTILFPIVAEIYDISSSHVKILSGSQHGVKSGQRYIIKNKKQINVGDKERTLVSDIGLVQIKKVNDDNSEAFVISLDDIDEKNNGAWAEEKYYSNIAFEFSALGAMNRGMITPWADGLYGVGAGILMGNLFQFGLAADIYMMGRYLGISPMLELRYNLHLYKGLFLVAGADVGAEMISTLANLRVPVAKTDSVMEYDTQKLTVTSLNFSATILAGFKLLFGANFYSVLTVGYIYSPDAKFKYVKNENTPSELKNSIEDYSPYIPTIARRGAKVALTFGYLF
jgi:hypothetical protein